MTNGLALPRCSKASRHCGSAFRRACASAGCDPGGLQIVVYVCPADVAVLDNEGISRRFRARRHHRRRASRGACAGSGDVARTPPHDRQRHRRAGDIRVLVATREPGTLRRRARQPEPPGTAPTMWHLSISRAHRTTRCRGSTRTSSTWRRRATIESAMIAALRAPASCATGGRCRFRQGHAGFAWSRATRWCSAKRGCACRLRADSRSLVLGPESSVPAPQRLKLRGVEACVLDGRVIENRADAWKAR